ncbi:MAG: hypothetical protein ABL952_12645 [Pyrinomonadaceae bacterium]
MTDDCQKGWDYTMKKLIFFALIVLMFTSSKALATAQYPDKIVYNGITYSLYSNPMEAYFEKNPGKKPKGEVGSSALWRGYVATFEIVNGSVHLKDIEIRVREDKSKSITGFKSVLEEVVEPGKTLKIDWFSGILVLPEGKLINYVHMGYESTYEKYILLAVEKSNFTSERRFDDKEYEVFKQKQFEEFKKTPAYKKAIDEITKQGNFDPKFADDFLKGFITSYTSKFLVN